MYPTGYFYCCLRLTQKYELKLSHLYWLYVAVQERLTRSRGAHRHPEDHTALSPPRADTPFLPPQGTEAPVCCECECPWEWLGCCRSWNRGSTRPTRSAGSLWGGHRTGQWVAGPGVHNGWRQRKKQRSTFMLQYTNYTNVPKKSSFKRSINSAKTTRRIKNKNENKKYTWSSVCWYQTTY